MKRVSRIVAGSLAVCAASATQIGPVQADPGPRTYEVTITTSASGQPLSPPLVALHRGSVDVFGVGRAASTGVQQIAENGAAATLASSLSAQRGVADVAVGSAPLVPAGVPGDAAFDQSVTVRLEGPPNARFLSAVSMLICTNDGFTGVDRLRLPVRVGQSVNAQAFGYDAGTERNTEDFADIVPPCQGLIGVSSGEAGSGTTNAALAEGGVVTHHTGIAGRADLVPSVHGWNLDAPIAMITVERVS